MAQINLSYEGQDYTLEFTKKTIRALEESGFNPREIDTKPLSTIPILFAGAFRAHHRFVKPEVIDAIYDSCPNKDELISALLDMYIEHMVAMVEDPKDDTKNVTWTLTK